MTFLTLKHLLVFISFLVLSPNNTPQKKAMNSVAYDTVAYDLS